MPAPSGLARSAVALTAALAITVCGTASAAAVTVLPDESASSERATATVRPALLRVTGTFVGRVHDRDGAYANNAQPYTVTVTCSGFGVHPDGYIATVGHCVDANDPGVRATFIRAAAEEAVANTPEVQLGEMMEYGLSAWAVEGQASGAPVASEIRVTGIPGAPSDGMLARVVDDRPIGQGDVGLLKVDTTDLPALELTTGSGMAVGTPLLVAGYAEGAGERIEPDATPSIMAGAVDGTTTDGGRPVYRVDAAMEVGVSGGPAVDDSGRVLGIASVRTSGADVFNLVIPISGFTDLLGRNGVRAELGPRDLRYREALDAYYGGEYTDVIDAIDRLQQEGPVHPRVGKLRTDAETSRDLYGDASENRLTQILIWVCVGTGAVVIVAIGVLLVVRRWRRKPVVIVSPPRPPFPGPQVGPPWQGGPGGPFLAPPRQPGYAAGPRNHPYGPAADPRAAAPRPPIAPPGRPGPASFDGPTRAIRIPRPAPPAEPSAEATPAE